MKKAPDFWRTKNKSLQEMIKMSRSRYIIAIAGGVILACVIFILIIGNNSERKIPRFASLPLGQGINIHLQEGFKATAVQIFAGGDLVYEGNPATNETLGFADGFSFTSDSNTIVLRILMTSKNIDSEHQVDILNGKEIGISVRDRKVEIRQTKTAFGYD